MSIRTCAVWLSNTCCYVAKAQSASVSFFLTTPTAASPYLASILLPFCLSPFTAASPFINSSHIMSDSILPATPMTPALSADGWGDIEEITAKVKVSTAKRSFSSTDSDHSNNDTAEVSRRPMRKRAKTQEEKEQRAQERVMRNRAAAQISRERKREYMATLEVENQELVDRVSSLTTRNASLAESVTTLSQRLESVEKMLSYFMAPASTPEDSVFHNDSTIREDLNSGHELPMPPGTIRPCDLQSFTSTSFLDPIDSRNPAVIARGPQRRSMGFPWNLSSRSPIYRQMISILVFWTTILRVTTTPTFAAQVSTSLRHVSYLKVFRRRNSDHRRSLATGPMLHPKVPQASDMFVDEQHYSSQ